MTTEAAGDDLENWRALVYRLAEQADLIAAEVGGDNVETRDDHLEQAAELRRLGRWLDSLLGQEMRLTPNGHEHTRP